MTQAYPLHWPHGMPRTVSTARGAARFRTSLNGAVDNVQSELRRFGKDTGKPVTDVVISSNVSLGNYRPSDAGVAVYFRWDGIDCSIAVDRYTLPEANLQAVALIVEAERTKMRHGGLNIVRASFRGYASLPPPRGADGQIAPPWWSVLGFDKPPSLQDAENRYRKLVKATHPDTDSGDVVRFIQIGDAIKQAREELGPK